METNVLMAKSPYLKDHQRLGNVISAIQVMGKCGFYKLDCADWAKRITGNENNADEWRVIFKEHPEFFRFGDGEVKAALVWRRSYRKRYNVKEERNLSFSEYSALSEEQKKDISRTPLTGDEIAVLIQTAIELHSRAIEQNREYRWLSTPLLSILGGSIAALIGWFSK
ncbi:N-carbamoyl-L-amino acid amidohydrolase [Aliivibrio sp. S10_S31]|uniref:N-carbamoyl-L-amino acid amidohydrolase n=1 Tax=Aliivibrio sp. S10_S31 TaxID=2720224 RepID=UPI001680BA45|nr:N-carbamoyl-L-amino acid amidohydrolase [Aliivibrio sp. S10_S31]MBD1571544.1 N-carbamoyl-L-amino acid amidohydrolase [Aliivibrio sp. S10_S31]